MREPVPRLKDVVLDLTAKVDERYYPEGTPGLEEDAFTYKFDVVDQPGCFPRSPLHWPYLPECCANRTAKGFALSVERIAT